MSRPSPDASATTPSTPRPPLALWGGVECTVNRVGDRVFDQMALTGHADRLDDLDRFAALGLTGLRVALLWERIERSPGELDWSHADAVMARVRSLGLRPIVGLVHHGSGPLWTDLTQPAFASGLARHAARVVERYPWVEDWTPVNEPLTTARFSCLYGLWWPHLADEGAFWTALVNQVEATRLAMEQIRRRVPHARLVQTDDFGHTTGTAACADQAGYENHRRLMTWDLLAGRVTPDHPLFDDLAGFGLTDRLASLADDPCPADVIGVDYYVTSDRYLDDRLDRYPPELHGGNGRIAYVDTETVRVDDLWRPGWASGLQRLHRRYGRSVAVTECHLGCDPAQQGAWLNEAWQAALAARDAGVDVEAVTVWALAGSVGWDRLLTGPHGRYEPGVLDASRPGAPESPLADVVRALASGREAELRHPIGWWRRPDRLFSPPDAAPAAASQPLVA